jgi:Integrase zinc binding domain
MVLDIEQQVYNAQGKAAGRIQEWAKMFPLNSVNHHQFYRMRPVVVEDLELRRNLLHIYHDHKVMGHPGMMNTFKVVAQNYWWPEMKQFVVQYVRGCATCQSNKPNMV